MNHSLRWISAQKTSYPVDSTNLFSMLFTIKKKSCLMPKAQSRAGGVQRSFPSMVGFKRSYSF